MTVSSVLKLQLEGLQTSNDETGKLICRGYNSADFTNAVLLLNKYNIDIVTHIMVGLPGEKISGDAPKDILVAPSWNLHKKWILNGFDMLMRENDLFQGMYYYNNTNS